MHFTLTYKKKALKAFRFIRSLANLKVQMKLQFTLTHCLLPKAPNSLTWWHILNLCIFHTSVTCNIPFLFNKVFLNFCKNLFTCSHCPTWKPTYWKSLDTLEATGLVNRQLYERTDSSSLTQVSQTMVGFFGGGHVTLWWHSQSQSLLIKTGVCAVWTSGTPCFNSVFSSQGLSSKMSPLTIVSSFLSLFSSSLFFHFLRPCLHPGGLMARLSEKVCVV